MPKSQLNKITICGFGLIGGCMALDFLKSRSRVKIFAYDKPSVLRNLKRDKRFKLTCQPIFEKAVENTDIVILSAPHKANKSMLTRLSKIESLTNSLIIDTGAVKQPIATLAAKLIFTKGTQFLPTHPMAGREKAGFANSAAELFINHSWFIDESAKLNKNNKIKLTWMIKQLGTEPTYIQNKLHDELMSEISHLPQIISTILGGQVNPNLIALAGPGLRSMLRLSGSPYSVWSEIISENRTEIIKALRLFNQNLNKVTRMIEKRQSLSEIFKDASRSYQCL